MRVYGNVMNRILEHTTNPPLTIGMGATIYFYSDRIPATLIKASPSGKTLWLREDEARRTDTNGMSEAQTYTFHPNPTGRVFKATLRKNGTYKTSKGNEGVSLGRRSRYHDYSF